MANGFNILIPRFTFQCTKCPRLPCRYKQFSSAPLSRGITSSTTSITAIAAPEIDFSAKSSSASIRIVPASPSYFTAKPQYTDNLLLLQALLRKYQTLPSLTPAQAPRSAWRTLSQYNLLIGEEVKASKYHKVIQVLQRLNRIHPSLMPEEVVNEIKKYRKDINPHDNRPRPQTVDADRRAYGHGRRKASTARVYLVEGTGEVLVNGQNLNHAFPRIHDRESAIWALKATGRVDKYNVWALVRGGGLTGQAESITLAVAKALMVHEPALKPALRRGK